MVRATSCSTGFRSTPSGSAGCRRSKGLEVASENSRKPALITPSTPSTRATKVRGSEEEQAATASVHTDSTNTQNSMLPSWLPQVAAMRKYTGSAELELAATSRTEKSLCTKAHTRQPKASASSTNCPATAGYTACIQRCCPRQDPARPKKVCAAASSNARSIAYCPISGIMSGTAPLLLPWRRRVFQARFTPAQRFLHGRRHVVLVVLGQHLVGHEHAVLVQAAIGHHARILLEQVGQHAVVDHRHLGLVVGDHETHLERAGRALHAARLDHAAELEALAGPARAGG